MSAEEEREQRRGWWESGQPLDGKNDCIVGVESQRWRKVNSGIEFKNSDGARVRSRFSAQEINHDLVLASSKLPT